jgi:hypothetical protein
LKTTIAMLTILCIAPFFAACGDEEDDSGDSSSDGAGVGGTLLCIAWVLVSGDDECVNWITSGSSGAGSSSTGGNISTVGFAVWDEAEPNNSWLNAMPIIFPTTTKKDGFIVKGSISDATDLADLFSVTRTYTRWYNIRLCAGGNHNCNEYGEIDTLTAYIDILDQYGKMVGSTQGASGSRIRVRMTGSVPFYIRIVPGDSMGASVDYELITHEDDHD